MSPNTRSKYGPVLLVALLVGAGPLLAQEAQEEPSADQLQRQLEELEAEREQIEQQSRETRRDLDQRIQAARKQAREARRAENRSPSREGAAENLEAPPESERSRRVTRRSSDAKFAFGQSVRVEAHESVPDVLVLGGRALVEGEVRGDVVVFGGGARIDGHVEGDVISVGNDVELGAEAEVERDVVAVGGKVRRADGARVGGRVSELDVAPGFDFNAPSWSWARRGVDWAERGAWGWGSWVDLSWSMMGTLLMLVLTGLIVLVVPRQVGRTGDLVFQEPLRAILTGLAIELLLLPALVVLSVLLAVSIIGIPVLILLALMTPFLLVGLVATAFYGFASSAVGVGRYLKARFSFGFRNRFLFLATGLIAIQGFSLAEQFLDAIGLPFPIYFLFGLVGVVVKYLAWTAGLGAAVLGRWGGRSRTTQLPPTQLPPLPAAAV